MRQNIWFDKFRVTCVASGPLSVEINTPRPQTPQFCQLRFDVRVFERLVRQV